jgi:hypothetical protein
MPTPATRLAEISLPLALAAITSAPVRAQDAPPAARAGAAGTACDAAAEYEPIVLSGTVTRAHTGPLADSARASRPVAVADANVFLLETLDGALTDSAGGFRITTRRCGAATLVIGRIRYRPLTRDLVVAPAEDGAPTPPLALALEPQVPISPTRRRRADAPRARAARGRTALARSSSCSRSGSRTASVSGATASRSAAPTTRSTRGPTSRSPRGATRSAACARAPAPPGP